MPPAYKRPAAALAVETPQSGRRKTVPTTSEAEQQCEVITAALRDTPGVPEAAKDMLIAALPPCLSVTREKRHTFQHDIVGMANEALATIQKELETDIANKDAKLADSAGEKQRRGSATSEAKTKADDAETLEAQRLTAKTEAKETEKTKQAALAEAMKQEKSSLIQFEKVSAKKTSFESLVSTQLEPLKSAGGGKREISALAKALGAFEGLDASLLQALSTVLAKPADQHSSFDQIVIKQLDEALSDVKGKLDAELEVVDADKMEKASSKDAAQAARNKAKEAYDNAHSDHEEAVEARAGAKKALQEAENAQNSYDADMREVASALDAANEALVTFKNGPVERFTCLRDKETPAEPPMEVTLPEEEVPAPAKDSVAEAAAE
jgi:hypothetical protein